MKTEKTTKGRLKNPCHRLTKNLTTSFFFIGCAIGCYTQIHNVTVTYLKYTSVTNVRVEIPVELPAPALSVCLRYADVIDIDKLVADGKVPNSSISGGDGLTPEEVRSIQSLVTIADIFKYTPASETIMESCVLRMPNSYSFEDYNSTDCYKNIDIYKFSLQEFVCYRFTFLSVLKINYRFRNLAYALAYPGLFYSVTFNISTFERADYVKVILNPAEIRPYRSAAFAPSFWRRFRPETKKAKYNFFTVTYTMLVNERLPPPYNTSCVNYQKERGVKDANDCVRKCLMAETTKNFNRYPYSILINEKGGEDLSKKAIVINDLLFNDTVAKDLYLYEHQCSSTCSALDCKVEYSMTQVAKEPQSQIMTFQVNIPQGPTYTIVFAEKTKFIEYFIYVLSCFGTWFGLSILSLNPFRWNVCGSGKKKSTKIEEQTVVVETRPLNQVFHNKDLRVGVKKKNNVRDPITCSYCMETYHSIMDDLEEEISLIQFLLDASGRPRRARLPNPARRRVTFSSRHRLPQIEHTQNTGFTYGRQRRDVTMH